MLLLSITDNYVSDMPCTEEEEIMAKRTFYSRVMLLPKFRKAENAWSFTDEISELAFRIHLTDGLEIKDFIGAIDEEGQMRTSLVRQGIFTRGVHIVHHGRAQRGIVYHHEIRASKIPDFEGWPYGIQLQCGHCFTVMIPHSGSNTSLLRFLARICPPRHWDVNRGIRENTLVFAKT